MPAHRSTFLAPGKTLALLLFALSGLGMASASPNSTGQEAPIVVRQKQWTILSSAINRYTAACVSNGPNQDTWLGTPLGIKRITSRGSRIYTSLDGLPAGTVRAITHHERQVWCVVVPDSQPQQLVYLCRWNRAADRWLAQPPLKLSEPLPRLLLSASGKDIYLATSGTGMNPVDSLYRFVDKTRSWQPLPLPGSTPNATVRITFLHPNSDGGIFLGTTTGLFQWQQDKGWSTHKAGVRTYGGVREPNGTWWLVAPSGSRKADSLELLRLDTKGAMVSRSPFSVPANERMLPDFSLSLVETREKAASSSSTLWAVGLKASRAFPGSGLGGAQLEPWVVRFNPSSKDTQVVSVETPEEIARVPMPVAQALLTLEPNLPQDWAQRFTTYDTPPSDTPTPPSSYAPSVYRGEAGTDTDGSTWDRTQNSGLVRTTPSGSREEFPLPSIRLPVRGDISGVALTPQGALLALTRDSLLRHEPGTAADAWNPVTVPYSNPSTTWYSYSYDSRLLTGNEGTWLATGAFALHLPVTDSPEAKSPLVTNGSSGQTLLGTRKDGSAWLAAGETIQLICPEGGTPLRSFSPATLPPGLSSQQISPLHSIGGIMGDTVWYEERTSLLHGNASSALVGYDAQKERWTSPLPCYRTIALRSGTDGESTRSEAAWALIEDNDDVYTLRLMYWKPETGTWERVGSPLPDKARINNLPLRVVRAQPDSVWIVDRDQLILYHWDSSGQKWNTYPAPAGSGLLASNSITEAGVYAEHALEGCGPAIYVAGLTGLWEFKIESHTWRAIDLPSVGQWWIQRVTEGGPEAAWAILSHPATGTYAGGRFDKKKKTWTIYGPADGFPTTSRGDYTLTVDSTQPGQACWLLTHQRLYRFDSAGHWRNRTAEVTGGSSGIIPSKIVSTPTGDAWIVLGASSSASSMSPTPLVAQWLRKTDTFTVHYPLPVQQQNISGTDILPEANGDALLGTTRGVFRWEGQKKAWSRLDIPAFPEMPVHNIMRTSHGLWLLGQDRYAWRQP